MDYPMIDLVLSTFAYVLGPIAFFGLIATAFANVIFFGKLNVQSHEYTQPQQSSRPASTRD
jgi:ABC-type enterochelin transport system permease subunit